MMFRPEPCKTWWNILIPKILIIFCNCLENVGKPKNYIHKRINHKMFNYQFMQNYLSSFPTCNFDKIQYTYYTYSAKDLIVDYKL